MTHSFSPRMALRTLILVAISLLLTAPIAPAQDVPHKISYQGIIYDATGTAPIANGSHAMKFTLYSDATGTTPKWTNTQGVVTSNGVFSVLLGDSGMALPVPMQLPMWLGVSLEGGAELRPLTQIVAAPYALGIADSTVTEQKIQDSAVTTQKIGPNFVGRVTLDHGAHSTNKGKNIDIAVGPNLTMTVDSQQGNLRAVIDGPPSAALPSGSIVLFPTAGPYPGYTFTGQVTHVGQRWTPKAMMSVPRTELAAATVGGNVLAVGGYGNANPYAESNALEMFDPATNTWTAKPNMPTTRTGLVAAEVNGKLYAIGGALKTGASFTTVEEFDPSVGANGTWTAKASMNFARKYAAVAVLSNRIYVMGGQDGTVMTNAVEVFDPNLGPNGTWTVLTNMLSARANFNGAALNGKIYVTGGSVGGTTVEQFDPSAGPTGTWTQMIGADYPSYCSAGFGGKMYVFSTPQMWSYDPALGTAGTFFNHPANSQYGAAAAATATRIYLVGGSQQGVGYCTEYTPPITWYYFSKD